MPSFAFGSHHHLANPTDSPYTVEISIDGDSSDLDSLSEVDLESGGVTKLHSGGGKKRRTRRRSARFLTPWVRTFSRLLLGRWAIGPPPRMSPKTFSSRCGRDRIVSMRSRRFAQMQQQQSPTPGKAGPSYRDSPSDRGTPSPILTSPVQMASPLRIS